MYLCMGLSLGATSACWIGANYETPQGPSGVTIVLKQAFRPSDRVGFFLLHA